LHFFQYSKLNNLFVRFRYLEPVKFRNLVPLAAFSGCRCVFQAGVRHTSQAPALCAAQARFRRLENLNPGSCLLFAIPAMVGSLLYLSILKRSLIKIRIFSPMICTYWIFHPFNAQLTTINWHYWDFWIKLEKNSFEMKKQGWLHNGFEVTMM